MRSNLMNSVAQLRDDKTSQRLFIELNLNKLSPLKMDTPPWWYERNRGNNQHAGWFRGGHTGETHYGATSTCEQCWQKKYDEFVQAMSV